MKKKLDISVSKHSASEIFIQTNENIRDEIGHFFKGRPKGYQFMPLFKSKRWDGFVRFFKDAKLPIGLTPMLKEFAEHNNYSYKQNFKIGYGYDRTKFEQFVKSIVPSKFERRDFQYDAAYNAITQQIHNIESMTSSGKSLIMYFILRYLISKGKKCLVVVPTTTLVEQLANNFLDDYQWEETYDNITKIYHGEEKVFDKPIIISTWQSMFKREETLAQFDCVMIDEAHTAQAASLQQLSKMAINAKWRIGLSGTYPIKKRSAEFFGIVGALGNIQKYNDYELLRKNEQVSELKIFNLFLHYPDNITRACFELYGNKSKEEEQMSDGRVDFAKDVEFVMNLGMRNQFIVNFAMKTTGNTIVLFTRKDHGKKLFQMMQDSVQKEMPYDSQKEIFYIDGDVKTKKREEIRKYTNENENVVVVCSFGTFSVGVDIKNLHNAIYASNYKEQTKVIQSIGRIIRQLVGKVAKVYNLIDDFTYKHVKKDEDTGKMVRKTFVNFDMKHHKERLRLYKLHKYHDITNINISIGQGKNFEHD